MVVEIANLLNFNAKNTSNLGDLLVDFFGELWEEIINDTDVNENDFLSEPEDEFDPRQTDFESVMKHSDEYIKTIEQEMNKLVIYAHVISRPRNAMLSLLNTYIFPDW